DNVPAGKARAIECDADSCRKNGVHKPGCVADHDEAIAADLLHGITVVTLIFQRTKLLGLLEGGVAFLSGRNAIPEEFLPRLLGLGEILLLSDDADTGDPIGDGYLPNPAIAEGKMMDVNVAFLILGLGNDAAVIVLEPGMQRILIEDLVADLEFLLDAQ